MEPMDAVVCELLEVKELNVPVSIKRRTLTELSILRKKEVLDLLDKGVSQRKLAEQFQVGKTTIGNINKSRNEILKLWEKNGCENDRQRKLRKSNYEPINVILLEFVEKCRSAHVSISGPMLQFKAVEIARRLGLNDFKASNGWLDSFRKRNNISFKVVAGAESAHVDVNAACGNWELKFLNILQNYSPENIFNAAEIGLFYKQIPSKSLLKIADECKGGKLAEERINVLLCCSSTGEKIKPLVIGNAANPRVFQTHQIDVKCLPVTWKSNKRVWMTNTIFTDWLRDLNQSMKQQNRDILLLVDNATSHADTKLSNVTVQVLPSNVTTCQPLNQGIVHAMKLSYRKKMLQSLVTKADQYAGVAEFNKSITVFDAVRWINSCWLEISETTIRKCFQHAGFPSSNDTETEEQPLNIGDVLTKIPVDIRQDLMSTQNMVTFEDPLPIHEEIASTPEDILDQVLQENEIPDDINSDDTEGENGNTETTPRPKTHKDALECVSHLMTFSSSKVPAVMDNLFSIYSTIEADWAQSMKRRQSKRNVKKS